MGLVHSQPLPGGATVGLVHSQPLPGGAAVRLVHSQSLLGGAAVGLVHGQRLPGGAAVGLVHSQRLPGGAAVGLVHGQSLLDGAAVGLVHGQRLPGWDNKCVIPVNNYPGSTGSLTLSHLLPLIQMTPSELKHQIHRLQNFLTYCHRAHWHMKHHNEIALLLG